MHLHLSLAIMVALAKLASHYALKTMEVVSKASIVRRGVKLSSFHFSRVSIIFSLLFLSYPFTYAADNTTAAGADYKTAAEFAMGLFTDLAPVLSLFGTEFFKQFISQSIDWADDFLFAMAPLGIIKVVVGAIRVSGCTTLRTLIGRACELTSSVELEFLSSTLPDICETWDTRGVTQKANNQSIKAVLYDN